MVSQITLGNFFTTADGKNVLGGAGGSGLDTQSIINALTASRTAQSKQYQDQITLNDKQSAALSTFQNLLSTLQSSSDALRNPPGVANEANNVFKFASASVTSNTAVGGSNYLSVAVQPGTPQQAFTISDITSLATAATQSTDILSVANTTSSVVTDALSPVAGKFEAGTVTLNSQAVTLAIGDSLATVAAKFNAVSDKTGVTASIVQISSTQFQLAFSATKTGTVGNFDLTSPVFSQTNLSAAVPGTTADFKLNNTPVHRQTNTVSDLVTGMTFNLLQETPDSGTRLSISMQPDLTTAQNSIINFVNAYNAIKTFAAQQTQLNADGTYADTAVLANNSTFRTIMASVNQEVTSQVAGITGTNPKDLADVGITLINQPADGTNPPVSNILNVDDAKLASSLASNLSGVVNLLGFNLTSSNQNIKVFSETNALSATSFTLNLTPVGHTVTLPSGADFTFSATTPGLVTINSDPTALGLSVGSVINLSGTGAGGLAINGINSIDGTAYVTAVSGTSNFTIQLPTTVTPPSPLSLTGAAFTVGASSSSIVISGLTVPAGLKNGDTIHIAGAPNVGGLTGSTDINGDWPVSAVTTGAGGQFTITIGATSDGVGGTTTGGGTASAFDLTGTITGATVTTKLFTAKVPGVADPVILTATTLPLPTSAPADVTGYTLTGPANSPLEGLKLIYGSITDSSATITATQGIADKLFNSTTIANDSASGLLTKELTRLKDSDTKLNTNVQQVNDQVSQYQKQLVAKFAALEQAISQVNTLLSSLNANANAALTASGH